MPSGGDGYAAVVKSTIEVAGAVTLLVVLRPWLICNLVSTCVRSAPSSAPLLHGEFGAVRYAMMSQELNCVIIRRVPETFSDAEKWLRNDVSRNAVCARSEDRRRRVCALRLLRQQCHWRTCLRPGTTDPSGAFPVLKIIRTDCEPVSVKPA